MMRTYRTDENVQISAHFNSDEFQCKCGKIHDFQISEDLISKLEMLFEKLNCSKIIVTSGYRCAVHDRNVGGNGSGQHTKGTAADICCYDKNNAPIDSRKVCCATQDVGFSGIANINSEYIFTHVDVRSGAKWYGDETKGNNSVTTDFHRYFGIYSTNTTALNGIDISEHNGNIDWKKVDVDFVILRAGYGKLLSQKDAKFEENYSGAKSVKIPVGAYWYSYATTVEEVKKEAEICLKILGNKQFEYPVFFDLEEKSALDTGKNNCSEMVRTFCEILEKSGYFAGLYISRSFLETHIDDKIKSKYALWVAEYDTEKLNYNGSVGMWQKSCKACISGISGDVDIDICYENYPEKIKNNALNGYGNSKKSAESLSVEIWIGGKKYSGKLTEN